VRLAGQMLKGAEIISNTGKNQYAEYKEETRQLSDLGLTKNESSTYQKIASIPENV